MNNPIPLANETPFFLGQYCFGKLTDYKDVPVKTDGNFKPIFMTPNTSINIVCLIKIIESEAPLSVITIKIDTYADAYRGSINFFNYVDG